MSLGQGQGANNIEAIDHVGLMTPAYEVQIDELNPSTQPINGVVMLDLHHPNVQRITNFPVEQTSPAKCNTQYPGSNDRVTRSKSANQFPVLIVDESSEKTPALESSYVAKAPLLKKYFNHESESDKIGEATCLACNQPVSDLNPDGLLEHLSICNALSQADSAQALELINGKNQELGDNHIEQSQHSNDQDTSHRDDDKKDDDTASLGSQSAEKTNQPATQIVPLVPGPQKRIKKEHPERKALLEEALTRYTMVNKIPLKCVHSKEFTEFVKLLDPEFKIPSRETITTILIPKLLRIL